MKTLITTLLTLLLIWSWTVLAQQTTESAFNWVEMPDQNPFPPPTKTDDFGYIPQLIDFDGDEDLDAFDSIYYYENLGTAKEPKFKTPPTKITEKFFDGVKIEGRFRFVDIDNDNDWDIFVSPYNVYIEEGFLIRYYENTGQKNTPVYEERTGTANPLAGVRVGTGENVDVGGGARFVDIDADQDLDIFFQGSGTSNGPFIQYYENIGDSNHPQFEKQTDSANNPLREIATTGDYFLFADSDQDGDLDVFMISSAGMIYYENTGTATQPQFEERPLSANPFNEIALSVFEPIDIVDIDNDNDLDIFEGQTQTYMRGILPITYYENTGSIHSPRFVEDHTLFQEPGTLDVGVYAYPKFVDIDNDGDQDAFMGGEEKIYYYENIGNARSPQFVKRTHTANPLHAENHFDYFGFVDLDNDGDWDIFGKSDLDFQIRENTGTASHPRFVENLENPLGDIVKSESSVYGSVYCMVDIDHDEDMDIFSILSGEIKYFENIGGINAPVFAEYSGNANPLDGIKSVKQLNFYDMDHDGDWDAILTTVDHLFHYYENVGGSSFPVFEQRTDQNNPFFTLQLFRYLESYQSISLNLVDLNNDGQAEAFIGLPDGTIKYYKNLSQPSNNNPYVFKKSLDNPLTLFNAELSSRKIHFADLDNDDDWDMFTKLNYYENRGDSDNPRFVGESENNVIHKTNATNTTNAVPTDAVILVDLNQDEKLDLIMSDYLSSEVLYFENVGTASSPRFDNSVTNPFKVITASSELPHTASNFDFVDIDNDRDLDMFVVSGLSANGGDLMYFENIGNGYSPNFEERFETANPLGEFFNKSKAFTIVRCPRFVDIDNDGDWDAFVVFYDVNNNRNQQSFRYFENIGDVNQPKFEERTDTANPLAKITGRHTTPGYVWWATPAFVDLDGDSDWDIIMGHQKNGLRYFENTGSATIPEFVERIDHPLDWVAGSYVTPYIADFDQDGDWDIFVKKLFFPLRYYENTGSATHPVFQPSASNPFSKVAQKTVLFNVVDIDDDTDKDLFISDGGGIVKYYENIGDINSPEFVERTEPFTNLLGDMPTFVDIDNDQDWDAFVWYYFSTDNISIRYYENIGQADQPQLVERIGTANPLEKIAEKLRSDENIQLGVLHFIDCDSDGDLDLIILGESKLWYYENIGQPDEPKFIENNTANPFKDLPLAANNTLIDMDKDGDMDVFIWLDNEGLGQSDSEYYVNTSIKRNILADNYALPSGGKYSQGREINLGCLDCTQIYYTIDGGQPTVQSTLFIAPFNISETTTVKFFTVDVLGNASKVITEQYLIDTQAPVFTLSHPVNNQVLLEIGSIEAIIQKPEGGSEVDRIELQIHNGPLYLSGDNDDPFTTSAKWIKFPLTFRDQWYHDFGRLQLPVGPYTITARAYDFAGNFTEDTLTVIKVEKAISDLFLELSSATLLNDATLNAKGNLASRRYPAIKENLTGLPIELTITAPDGSTETHTTEILSDIGQYEFNKLSDFTLEGAYTLQTRFAGNKLLTDAVSSQQTVLVGESAGYAIIIQGKIENEEGLDSHNKTTNRIYQVLKKRGFEDANIFYFTPNPAQEGIEIDGEPTVADFVTIEEMQNRINGSPAPFYLIMVNHGDPNGNFYINDAELEFVTPEIWSDWLDALEAGLTDLSKPRIIMLGYCFSGKTLEMLSKPGRIVISSADADEESYKGPREPDGIRGGEYFMDDFFKNLGRGESFREAFEKSSVKTKQFTTRGGRFVNIENEFGDESVQHPLIDANGDGQGNNDVKAEVTNPTNPVETEPTYRLSEMFLGAGADYDTNYAGNPADIINVVDTIYLTPEQTAAELYLIANDVRSIKEAAVNVRLPSTELELADTSRTGYAEQREIAELVEINLLCDFSQRCARDTDEVTPDLFSEPGKYDLFYFVVDNETDNMSPIQRSVVYKNKTGNEAPAKFALLAPENAAKTKTAVTFDWETTTDADNDPMTYTLVIAADANFSTVVYQNEGIRKSEFALDSEIVLTDGTQGLKDNTTYYWKVAAVDYFGGMTESGDVFLLSTE